MLRICNKAMAVRMERKEQISVVFFKVEKWK